MHLTCRWRNSRSQALEVISWDQSNRKWSEMLGTASMFSVVWSSSSNSSTCFVFIWPILDFHEVVPFSVADVTKSRRCFFPPTITLSSECSRPCSCRVGWDDWRVPCAGYALGAVCWAAWGSKVARCFQTETPNCLTNCQKWWKMMNWWTWFFFLPNLPELLNSTAWAAAQLRSLSA